MQITRPLLRELREEMADALAGVARKFDVSIEVGTASFQSTNATFKVHVVPNNADGSESSIDGENFKRHAASFGFQPTDLGRKFHSMGTFYTIVGLKPKSWKRPILATDSRGKTYKFTAETAKKFV
tara:strand:- start:492 stop:869 length:378 start_codon:yes stop_codon:yes gene_type:complete